MKYKSKTREDFFNTYPKSVVSKSWVAASSKKAAFLFIVFCFFMTTTNMAQQPGNQKNIPQKIEQYVEEVAENLQIPAVTLALVKDGAIVHTSFFGKAPGQNFTNNNSSLIPITVNISKLKSNENILGRDTPFLIGSVSKTLTAYGVLKLVEKDLLSLDDPVRQYLPSLGLSEGTNGNELSVKHLLTHQSGIGNFTGMKYADLGLTGEDAIGEAIQQLLSEKILLQPGERYEYSPANYLLLAGIIEAITGKKYSEYMKKYVFQPLGMENTSTSKKNIIRSGLVQGYQSWFGYPVPTTVGYDNSGAPYGYIAASIKDMATFLAALQKEEEIKSEMFKPWVKTSKYTAYGLGARIIDTGEYTLTGHGGANGNFRSEMWLVDSTGWGFVLLTNINHALEEGYLMNISAGIASIIAGNDPAPVQKNTPTGRWVFLAIVITLIPISLYWWYVIFTKKIVVSNRWFWRIISVLLTVFSIGIIPLFINTMGFPWHTLWLFIPDIVFTLLLFNLILMINAILSIRYYYSS